MYLNRKEIKTQYGFRKSHFGMLGEPDHYEGKNPIYSEEQIKRVVLELRKTQSESALMAMYRKTQVLTKKNNKIKWRDSNQADIKKAFGVKQNAN